MGGAQFSAVVTERWTNGNWIPSRSGRRHSADGPARSNHTTPEGRGERGEGKTEGGRREKDEVWQGGTRYAVGPGMGLVADDGEGLGVTRVSAGRADDGGPPRADSGTAQARPSCHGCRLGDRIYVLIGVVKGVAILTYVVEMVLRRCWNWTVWERQGIALAEGRGGQERVWRPK